MSEEEFFSLLDQLGSDPARWPAHQRADAHALLARSAKARAGLTATQEVERLLASSLPAFDAGGIAARASRARQSQPPLLGPALRKASFAALGVVSLAAGILVGMTPASTVITSAVQMALNGGAGDVQ